MTYVPPYIASENPAFEVRCGDKVFKIWADGRTEGFEGAPGQPRLIINSIPHIVAAAIVTYQNAVLEAAAGPK